MREVGVGGGAVHKTRAIALEGVRLLCDAVRIGHVLFFFQAEDGIRYRDVTGVQTCALPIFGPGALAYGRGLKLQTLHEHWLICPMHVLWKFDRAACVQPHCLSCTLHGRRPPQWWRYTGLRSEERRVGKECRSRRWWDVLKK